MIHQVENINKDKLCKAVGIPYLKSIKSEKSIMEAHQQIQDGRRKDQWAWRWAHKNYSSWPTERERILMDKQSPKDL